MGKDWIPMFGEFFSPSDAKLIKRTSIPVFSGLKAYVVRAILFDIRQEKDDSFTVGVVVGLVLSAAMWLALIL